MDPWGTPHLTNVELYETICFLFVNHACDNTSKTKSSRVKIHGQWYQMPSIDP